MSTEKNHDRAAWDKRVKDAREFASQRWPEVIAALVPDLRGVIAKAGKHTHCPNPNHPNQRHGDAMRTLPDFDRTGGMVCNTCGLFPDGIAVLRWWHNWTFGEAIRHIEGLYRATPMPLPVTKVDPATRQVDPAAEKRKNDAKARKLATVWDGSMPLDAEDAIIARTYLQNRGIHPLRLPLPDVRFHPALPYYEEDPKTRKVRETGRHPAIVYVIRTADGHAGTLQRLYLASDGSWKADLTPSKKMMERRSDRILTGGACRLDHAVKRVLNVTEGFETALSVRLLTGLPTWCCASDTLLAGFQPPAGVDFIAVWGDLDPAGIKHADRLVDRLREEGRRAVAVYPTYDLNGRSKYDWNDALMEIGVDTIRKQSFYSSFFRGLKQKLAEQGEQLEVAAHGH